MSKTRNELRQIRREAVRAVIIAACFLAALFADSWVLATLSKMALNICNSGESDVRSGFTVANVSGVI